MDQFYRFAEQLIQQRKACGNCGCLDQQYRVDAGLPRTAVKWSELQIHSEAQDENCSAWEHLNHLIDQAAKAEWEEFQPRLELTAEEWNKIIELPAAISKLKSVKRLLLYGSKLIRIPPTIGQMESLEEFDPYTSYNLHWLPYEITRCKNLRKSRISTRALYGNYKYRLPFPQLPQLVDSAIPESCSICNEPLNEKISEQAWISLQIGTDVVPLLAHLCSKNCLSSFPEGAKNYLSDPHKGGLDLIQPPAK